MRYEYSDGGRAAAGFKGLAGDCVVRAVAITSGRPYSEVYAALSEGSRQQRPSKRGGRKQSARNGVNVTRSWFKRYMTELGFEWKPTMSIGSGCKVHLVSEEMPTTGRLVVSVSKHYTALIDGVIHDTFDPQRQVRWFDANGNLDHVSERCVYGYWTFRGEGA